MPWMRARLVVEVANDIAGVPLRCAHADGHDGFEENSVGARDRLLQRLAGGELEGHLA